MSKITVVAAAALVCIGAPLALAQSYGAQAPESKARTGLNARAQAPASKARAQVNRNQSEARRFKYDRDAGQHGITPFYYRPYYYGHYGYYGPWPP